MMSAPLLSSSDGVSFSVHPAMAYEAAKAEKLEKAVAGVIEEGKVRTYDMGGASTTLEMGQAIARKCKA